MTGGAATTTVQFPNLEEANFGKVDHTLFARSIRALSIHTGHGFPESRAAGVAGDWLGLHGHSHGGRSVAGTLEGSSRTESTVPLLNGICSMASISFC